MIISFAVVIFEQAGMRGGLWRIGVEEMGKGGRAVGR